MAIRSRFLGSTSATSTRRLALVTATGLLLTGSGFVIYPAFADQNCSTQTTGIGIGYPNGDAEQKARASNSGCSGTGKLEVKIMEDKTGIWDDEVAQGQWFFTASGSYTRIQYGCDPDDGSFYGEQNLWGVGKKESGRRAMQNCQLK